MKIKQATALTFLSVATFSLASPVFAQAPQTLIDQAVAKCTEKAQADGYTVNPNGATVKDSTVADKVIISLDLTKTSDNTKATLTCPYTEKEGAMFEQVQDTIADATPNTGVNWLWWLLPIIGIPLLYFLLKGRQPATTAAYNTVESDRKRVVERNEAVIRPNGDYLDVYSGPGTTYKVTNTLRNGQRVMLSGRNENEWVELEGGGWIPRQYVEATYRQV